MLSFYLMNLNVMLLYLHRKQRDMNEENVPKSLIYDNYDKYRLYYNGTTLPLTVKSTGRIVVVVGTRINAYSIVNGLQGFLHKQYYAQRHGYKFTVRFSNAYEDYWPKGLWKVLNLIILLSLWTLKVAVCRPMVRLITMHPEC